MCDVWPKQCLELGFQIVSRDKRHHPATYDHSSKELAFVNRSAFDDLLIIASCSYVLSSGADPLHNRLAGIACIAVAQTV